MKKHIRGIRVFLLIYFLAGALGLSFSPVQAYFLPLVPFSLLLSYVFLALFHEGSRKALVFLLFAGVAMTGLLVEAIGVHSGLIFGEYAYGSTLGLEVWGVPLLIGGNWLMLTYCTHLILHDLKIRVLPALLLGSLLMTLYDWLMEPVAVHLDMWSWAGGGIPLQNYLAWFLLSFLFLGIFQLSRIRYANPLARDILVIQAGFFALMNLLINV
ncbi:MAG TPA: carotenoid biosynthesis protein [Bacteroidales bacterium]|nr:carotenoid biosynthesis protein [Bacteroidales bacterium]